MLDNFTTNVCDPNSKALELFPHAWAPFARSSSHSRSGMSPPGYQKVLLISQKACNFFVISTRLHPAFAVPLPPPAATRRRRRLCSSRTALAPLIEDHRIMKLWKTQFRFPNSAKKTNLAVQPPRAHVAAAGASDATRLKNIRRTHQGSVLRETNCRSNEKIDLPAGAFRRVDLGAAAGGRGVAGAGDSQVGRVDEAHLVTHTQKNVKLSCP